MMQINGCSKRLSVSEHSDHLDMRITVEQSLRSHGCPSFCVLGIPKS